LTDDERFLVHHQIFAGATQNHCRACHMGMEDAVDRLLENLLTGPSHASPDAWNRFGEHGESTLRCPLFKTDTMCSACCEHFTRDLVEKPRVQAAFDDAYTRFRLTARREVSRDVFRHLAAYACRRCPNNPMRGIAATEPKKEHG
jgi:hypothetical protein